MIIGEIPLPEYVNKQGHQPNQATTTTSHNGGFLLTDDGELLVVSNGIDIWPVSGPQSYESVSFAFLSKFSGNGELMKQVLLPFFKDGIRDLSYFKIIKAPDGNIVLLCEKHILVLDPHKLEILNEININGIANISWDDKGFLMVGLAWQYSGGYLANAIAMSHEAVPNLMNSSFPKLSIVSQFDRIDDWIIPDFDFVDSFTEDVLARRIAKEEDIFISFSPVSEHITCLPGNRILSQFWCFGRSGTSHHRFVILNQSGDLIDSIKTWGEKGSSIKLDRSRGLLIYKHGKVFGEIRELSNPDSVSIIDLSESAAKALNAYDLVQVNESGQALLVKDKLPRKYLVVDSWNKESLEETAKLAKKRS